MDPSPTHSNKKNGYKLICKMTPLILPSPKLLVKKGMIRNKKSFPQNI